MSALTVQDEGSLRAELRQARERLAALVQDLRASDEELESLSTERESHRLLEQACGALEELRERGAAGLFWGDRVGSGDEHLRLVRGRMAAFEKHIGEIEARRQEILEKVELQQESAEFIAGDVLDAEWQKEQRKLEWIVEREPGPLPGTPTVMPWSRGGEDDQRFRRTLVRTVLLCLLLGLLLPLVPLPVPEAWEPVEVPERLTRLIQEERPRPAAPPVPQQTRPTQPEEKLAEQSPKSEPTPKSKPDTRSKGILAFREQFSALAEATPTAKLGAKARISSAGAGRSARPTRSMVTSQAAASSGGINVASLSRNVGSGGEGIQRVEVTQATSSIGGLGGSDRPLSSGPGPSRTDEEIQIVFDRHKAALYRLYNRELRRDPTLQGQMVLRLTIEPDGSVSLCQLQSTDMKAPQLVQQVVERVKGFDFGAKDGIPPVTILYPIDFLPAA